MRKSKLGDFRQERDTSVNTLERTGSRRARREAAMLPSEETTKEEPSVMRRKWKVPSKKRIELRTDLRSTVGGDGDRLGHIPKYMWSPPPISSALWECQCFMTTSLLPPSRTILTCFHGTILSGHSKSSLSPPCHLSFVFQVFHLASHLFPPSWPPSLFLFYFSSFCVLSFCPHFLLRTLDVKWQKEKRGKKCEESPSAVITWQK